MVVDVPHQIRKQNSIYLLVAILTVAMVATYIVRVGGWGGGPPSFLSSSLPHSCAWYVTLQLPLVSLQCSDCPYHRPLEGLANVTAFVISSEN